MGAEQRSMGGSQPRGRAGNNDSSDDQDGDQDDDARWVEIRHELGNVSLLLDAAGRVSVEREARELLDAAKQRIDTLIVEGGFPSDERSTPTA